MDNRRLRTADVLYSGILNLPIPETEIPEERETADVDYEFEYIGRDKALVELEAGKVLKSLNYYGIPHVWKVADGSYRGTLLQYRVVTENQTFTSSGAALDWFEDRCGATFG